MRKQVCVPGTLCTITTAFNDPPQSRKLANFAFGSVTILQERLCVPGDCDSGLKFSSCYQHLFLPEESVGSFRWEA